jgi:hypothetical protein
MINFLLINQLDNKIFFIYLHINTNKNQIVMYEKILQRLKDQRKKAAEEKGSTNITDRSLEDLARSLESVITTDDILEKMDLTASIKSLDGNINHYTAGAVKKAQEDAEKAKKEAEEEAARKAEEEEEEGKKPDGEKIPAWAKKLTEQNEQLSQSLTTMQNEKLTSSRKTKLTAVLKDADGNDLPDYYTKPILEGFNQASFGDDDAFTNYLNGIKTNSEAFAQRMKENNITFGSPRKDAEVPEETGETESMAKARKILNEQKKKKEE